jgi:hypothetical protein
MLQPLFLDVSKIDRVLHLSPPTFCCISLLAAGAKARGDVGVWRALSRCAGVADTILFNFT